MKRYNELCKGTTSTIMRLKDAPLGSQCRHTGMREVVDKNSWRLVRGRRVYNKKMVPTKFQHPNWKGDKDVYFINTSASHQYDVKARKEVIFGAFDLVEVFPQH